MSAAYTSHADLGGTPSTTPVMPEPEPGNPGELWHGDWEPRALALTLAMGATGQWNIDQSRSARETLPDYARLSYYQIWLSALERLMAERGLVSPDELAHGAVRQPPRAVARVLHAADVAAALARGSATGRPAATTPRFAVGDAVRMAAVAPPHHSRVPGYTRGKRGLIERVHGVHVFADSHAQGLGEQPQWLYGVVFEGATLWGDEAQARTQVSIDAWESTLEPA